MRIFHAHRAPRLAAGLALAVAAAAPSQDPTVTDVDLARDVQPFVRRYCIECHGAVDPESELDLGALFQGPLAGEDALDGLYAVRDALRNADMPPQEEPQPEPAERIRVVEWLDHLLATAAGEVDARPGRVTMRRLSRYEYRNTIRDLLGVEVDVDSFPADDLGYGFDNVGDALSLSTIHLEKYAAAAERIAAEAFPDPDPDVPATLLVEGDQLEASNDEFLRGGVAGMFTNGWAGRRLRLPRAGRYQLRVLAWAQQAGPDVARMRVEVGTPGDGRPFAEQSFDVPAAAKDPGRYALDLDAPTDRVQIRAHFFNDYYDPDHRDPAQRDRNLYVGALELVGPLDRRPATLAERRFAADDSGRGTPAVRARKVLGPLLEQAWRRPVTSSEVRRFGGLVADVARDVERAEGGPSIDPYREGLRWAVQAALCSPHFLFRIESGGLSGRDGEVVSEGLDPWQLATRLSYFLWSSLPDDELRARAADGTLGDPQVLERQARRMLADPRAEALATHFAAQWLELRGLDEVEPDPGRFPDFSGSLAASMRRETELLFDHVRRADLPVQELLTADYSFVDAPLARLYGLDGVPDDGGFHRVDLRRTTRGGVLGHASVLTVTSIPTRTSPVKRGKWILDNLLGDAPPPPPPGNDAFAAGEAAVTTSKSLREQLAIHRSKAECAVCHNRMDALGLALERFDGIGRYRTGDEGGTILVASELPGGKVLDGLRGVREHLATDRAFAANLMAKLFVYATGREFRVTDALVVDSTLSALGADPTLDELLLAIVRLEAFRSRDLVAR